MYTYLHIALRLWHENNAGPCTGKQGLWPCIMEMYAIVGAGSAVLHVCKLVLFIISMIILN